MQSFTATVVSNKTPQTVGVQFSFFARHPKYQKIIKHTTKLLVHNELEGVREGDTVRIVKSRPYSKNKHFLLTEILAKGSTEGKTEETMEAKIISKETTKLKKKSKA